MNNSLHDSVNGSVNPSVSQDSNQREPLTTSSRSDSLPSRAPAEQGAGSREQGGEQGSIRSTGRNDALGRASQNSLTARLREIDRLDAATVVVTSLRPDWNDVEVRAILARIRKPWSAVLAAALACALDPGTRRPGRIETWEPGKPEDRPPSVAEVLAMTRDENICNHGGVVDRCPLCRGAA